MAEDPRFATNGDRCANVAELDAAIGAWTRTLPAREAEAALEAAEVPCSRLYDIRDCAEDPHFRARRTVIPVEDRLLGGARVLHPAAPFRLDGVSPADMVRWPGPAAGAHNDHVFRDLLGEG
jgi:formyl-CoA transferase